MDVNEEVVFVKIQKKKKFEGGGVGGGSGLGGRGGVGGGGSDQGLGWGRWG